MVGNFSSPKPFGLGEGVRRDKMRRRLRFWLGSDCRQYVLIQIRNYSLYIEVNMKLSICGGRIIVNL